MLPLPLAPPAFLLPRLRSCFCSQRVAAAMGKRARAQPSEDGPSALQRLGALGISRLDIGRVMEILAEQSASNRRITQSRRSRFEDVKISIPIQQSNGVTWDWPIAHPGHLLTRLVSESVPLQSIFASRLALEPSAKSSPWDLVIAFDEFVPGNKLRCDNRRKAMNLSFTFLQFGSRGGNGEKAQPSHTSVAPRDSCYGKPLFPKARACTWSTCGSLLSLSGPSGSTRPGRVAFRTGHAAARRTSLAGWAGCVDASVRAGACPPKQPC